jgi:cytochrome c peroxidase
MKNFVGILLFVASAATACSQGEMSLATSASSLEGDGTIARVPNPPPASDLVNLPGDLRAIAVPEPANLDDFVKDRAAAVRLGKALFWDMQLGSDGVQACASCHFRAGADPRSKNQVNPDTNGGDLTFAAGGPNSQLTPSDFPLTRLAVPGQRGELDPLTDNNDVVSSQGVFSADFVSTRPGRARDKTTSKVDQSGFRVGTKNVRRVEPRNTPTVINAVFNHRQFLDGRAENIFNGVDNTGTRNPNARLYQADSSGNLTEVSISLSNSSLASQAVAPPVSDFEMTATGRTHPDIGKKFGFIYEGRWFVRLAIPLRPLAKQIVSPTDSVLGSLSRYPYRGLSTPSYEIMIAEAFQDKYWKSSKLIRVYPNGTKAVVNNYDYNDTTDEYTLMQHNFSLFFGLAIQMYEATLVADNSPWDRFRRAHPSATDPALNPWTNTSPDEISRLALFGAHLFNDRTRGATNIRCSNCHEQNEMTDASNRRVLAATNGPVRNRDGNVIDKGFNNIGIRPTSNDLGVGGSDALGPLSHSKRLFPNGVTIGSTFDGSVVTKGFGVEGAFKTPGLINVALTATYFHNREAQTLQKVVVI